MTEVLAALLAGVVGLVGGYVFGIAQSPNERRDNALADIYGAMSLFYREMIAWMSLPSEKPYTAPGEPSLEWRDSCAGLGKRFMNTYFGNSIWLGRETDEMVNKFAVDAMGVLFQLARMESDGFVYPEMRRGKDLLEERLAAQYREIGDRLREEIEASRTIIPYRIVIKKEPKQGGSTPPG